MEKGVDVRTVNSDGRAALECTIYYSNNKMFKLLVQNGALEGIDVKPVLMEVTRRNAPEMVRTVLDIGQTVNISDVDGVTPLMLAVKNGNREMVKLMLDKGADVKQSDKSRQTALSLAREKGNKEIVGMLEKAGGYALPHERMTPKW